MAEWQGKTRGGAFGYGFFIWLIKTCGITTAYVFLCFVVVYFIPFAPKATRSIWQYGRRVLGYGRLRSVVLLFRNYYRLGQILIDKVAIGCGMKDKYRFRFDNYEPFLDILNSDREVVIIGAHVGNWEVGAPFFEEYGKKINVVMYDAEYQKIKEMLKKHSAGAEYKVIPVNQSDIGHVFQIREALDKKEYVCFQGDRYVNEERLLQTDFMGLPADFPMGPFLLSVKMKARVVFYFAMREKGRGYRFRFVLAEPVVSGRSSNGQALLRQYVAALEGILKEYPEQWFNYYDFWKLNLG